MPAYAIASIHVEDPEMMARYSVAVPEIVARHGGRYLVRGGAVEQVEGDWDPGRVVVLEFDSVEAASGMFASAEYQEIAGLRQDATRSNIVIVDGYKP
jgi:uncharacterized protein (DUF1330 family)